MKVMVGHDEDGHFFSINIRNRKKIWETLTEEMSDYFSDRDEDEYHINEENYLNISNGLWLRFLKSLEQRGTMELVDVEEDQVKEQLLNALSWAIHFGTNLPRGDTYDEAMKPVVKTYWESKEFISKEQS